MPQSAPTANYLDSIAHDIGILAPDCDIALLRIYAVLALTQGVNTTPRDVHDAWAAWRATTRPDHPDLVPFERLTPNVQVRDVPYAEAIRSVAERLHNGGWMGPPAERRQP